MTDRQEFVDRWRHEISGPILDVLFRDAHGGELSMLVRQMMRKVDTALGRAYDDLAAEMKPTNGNGVARQTK